MTKEEFICFLRIAPIFQRVQRYTGRARGSIYGYATREVRWHGLLVRARKKWAYPILLKDTVPFLEILCAPFVEDIETLELEELIGKETKILDFYNGFEKILPLYASKLGYMRNFRSL